jgi:hypothetical protein
MTTLAIASAALLNGCADLVGADFDDSPLKTTSADAGEKPGTSTASQEAGTGTSRSTCVTPASSYTVHLVENSGGTCGPFPDSVINTTANGSLEARAECSGSRIINGCTVLITDYTCSASNGATITETGQVRWASDGTTATGSVQITVSTTQQKSCSSSYVVTFTRQ